MRNTKLKLAIFNSGARQADIAKKANLPESYISMAVRGRINLSKDEKQRVAAVLKTPVVELF